MLEVRNLSFAFSKQDPLFEDFNLAINPGERLALQAPSGFGKTTLCRILGGYLQATSGEVLCEGKPLPKKGISPVQLIWQHPESAVDPRLRMKKTLEEAGVVSPELQEKLGIKAAWMARFPHELSGGELQRFCIARALTANPRYLVADEITTMLDAVTQAQIWKVLIEELEARNQGFVFVSHSSALSLRIATRVFDLDKLPKSNDRG